MFKKEDKDIKKYLATGRENILQYQKTLKEFEDERLETFLESAGDTIRTFPHTPEGFECFTKTKIIVEDFLLTKIDKKELPEIKKEFLDKVVGVMDRMVRNREKQRRSQNA